MKPFIRCFIMLLILFFASTVYGGTITITCDNEYDLYVNGVLIGSDGNWRNTETWNVDFVTGTNVVAVHGWDWPGSNCRGLIVKIVSDDGAVYVTDTTWKATANEVTGWTEPDFDDTVWSNACDEGPNGTEPWGFFPEFTANARWIWADPPMSHRVAYLRKSFAVGTVPADTPGTITITCDNEYDLYVNGVFIGSDANWRDAETWNVDFVTGMNVVAVQGWDWVGSSCRGLIVKIISDDGAVYLTDTTWKATGDELSGWSELQFDDSGWFNACEEGANGTDPWGFFPEFTANARWIWADPPMSHRVAYFRRSFVIGTVPTENRTWGVIKNLYAR